MPVSTADKRATFRKMHESGCFIIPNPSMSAARKALQHLGFKALASTSAGFAWTIGKSDNRITLEDALKHLTELCAAVDLPVNADFEGGFAHEAGQGRRQCRARGQDRRRRAVDRGFHRRRRKARCMNASSRSRASRRRAPRSMPTRAASCLPAAARAFWSAAPISTMVIDRLKAYSDAGADCLYAPGIKTKEQIAAVVKAVHPKPVNLLIGFVRLSLEDAEALGVRRISVGGSLARTAWAGFMRSAREMAEKGTFAELAQRPSRRRIEQDVQLSRTPAGAATKKPRITPGLFRE